MSDLLLGGGLSVNSVLRLVGPWLVECLAPLLPTALVAHPMGTSPLSSGATVKGKTTQEQEALVPAAAFALAAFAHLASYPQPHEVCVYVFLYENNK